MRGTPLWPAGHLPRKGRDRTSRGPSLIPNADRKEPAPKLPISPLEGEMPGRAERGASRKLTRLQPGSPDR
ncbi:hypothetical protein FJ420_32885, partial [Mesorhizobium sp. B3-1-3]